MTGDNSYLQEPQISDSVSSWVGSSHGLYVLKYQADCYIKLKKNVVSSNCIPPKHNSDMLLLYKHPQ